MPGGRNTNKKGRKGSGNKSKRVKVPYDGKRGQQALGGWWISLDEAQEECVGDEAWFFRANQHGRRVERKQHAKDAPSDLPVWLFDNGDMYLGEWDDSQTPAVEHGFGITYNAWPAKCKGLIYIGEWKDGHNHGQGESFWLESSATWRKNYWPGSPIRRPGGGIPFSYCGKYKESAKCDPQAVVRLKDGTTRRGPWKDGEPEGDWDTDHPSVAAAAAAASNAASVTGTEQWANVEEEDSDDAEDESYAASTHTSAKKKNKKPKKTRRNKPPVQQETESDEDVLVLPQVGGAATRHGRNSALQEEDEETNQQSRPQPRRRTSNQEIAAEVNGKAKSVATSEDESSVTSTGTPPPSRKRTQPVAVTNSGRKQPRRLKQRPPAVKQEPAGEDNPIELSSDSETDEEEQQRQQQQQQIHRPRPVVARPRPVAIKEDPVIDDSTTTAEEANEDRKNRTKQIQDWMTQDVIGNNPSPATMERYALRLFDNGFESVEMIKAYLKERHVRSFAWMSALHQEIFLDHIHENWE